MSTFLNILSYVVPNLIIALILVCGVISGTKIGWKKALIKLAYTAVLAVGTYFLSAFAIVPALGKIASLGAWVVLMPTIIWAVLFAATMGIAKCIYTIVCHCIKKKKQPKAVATTATKTNGAKQTKKTVEVKLTAEQKKEIRARKRKEHKEERARAKAIKKQEVKAWKAAHKKSRIFGGIIGAVSGLVMSFIVLLMVGQAGIGLGTIITVEEGKPNTVVEFVDKCYDNSVFGLVDGAVDKEASLAEKSLGYLFTASADKEVSAD